MDESGAVKAGELEDFAFSIRKLRKDKVGFALGIGEFSEFLADEFRKCFELASLFVRDLARALIIIIG
jgi:hypothetical protein